MERLKKSRKEKIADIVSEKGLYSCMNNTKWREFKNGIEALSIRPTFAIKAVDEEDHPSHHITNSGDWGFYLSDYLGGDMWAVPFYAVEYIKINPRRTNIKKHYRLVPDEVEVTDITEEFLSILNKYDIPFEKQESVYIIYGYRS